MASSTRRASFSQVGLLTWSEIFPWQRDNEFILTGYRHACFSHTVSLQSVFRIHNETANIWTHLLGALFFLALSIDFYYFWSRLPHDLGFQDALVVGIYVASVAVCFTFSTIFHIFSDHSPGAHKLTNELDHLGNVLPMWGTGVSVAHFGFYHHHAIRHFYLVLITTMTIVCAIFSLRPKFRQPTYRAVRFLMYVFLGTSMFVPILHGLFKFGWGEFDKMVGLESFFSLAVINFSGGVLYALRIPERWFPGQFDLLGHSHNLMHVFVIASATVRLNGLLMVIKQWHENTGLGE